MFFLTRNSKKEKNWTLKHFRCPFNNWNKFIIRMRWDFRKRFAYAANLDISAAIAFSKHNFFQILENASYVATANFSMQCVAEVFLQTVKHEHFIYDLANSYSSKKGKSSFFMVSILFPFSFSESLKRELNLFLNLKQHFQLELDGLYCVVCCCCKSMNNKNKEGDYFPLFSCQLFELKLSLHLRIVLKQTQKNLDYHFSNIFISICD